MNVKTRQTHNTQEIAKTTVLALLIVFVGTLPILIKYHGNLYLIGDYMTQLLPFIKESRRMILSGSPWWSHTSFLGANFIGTYAYYTLGSPFFWPFVCLPERLLGIGLTVAFACKHMTAAVCAYLFFCVLMFAQTV